MIVIVLYKDKFKNIETVVNHFLVSSQKEDNTKGDDGGETMHSRVENENMGDTSSSNYVTEIQFNSLNDPLQPTSVFDDGYCIYQTPTPSPSRTNDFTPDSRTFSAMARYGRHLPSRNQHPYLFGYMPVSGIAHYFPCWLPSCVGWIACWISWISPSWIWPSFL